MSRIKNWLRHPLRTLKNMLRKTILLFVKIFYRIWYGKNIILFESHYEFDGNSGALYNYLRKDKKYDKYTFVWIVLGFEDGSYRNTRHDLVFSNANRSFLKKYLMKNAKFAFYDDVPVKPGAKGAKTIYLTHGQIGLKNVIGIINTPDYVDYAICISDYYKPILSKDINCPVEKLFVCGLPRNDILFAEKVDVSSLFDAGKYKKIVLWLPTFRKIDWCERNDTNKELPFGIPFFYSEEQLKTVNDFLKEKDMLLVLKLHPRQDLTVIRDLHMSNIVFIDHKTLIKNRLSTNALYPHTDAMISDYSAVATDYILLDKPVAYIVEDQNDYKLKLPDDVYERRTPGTKIKTFQDFIAFLQAVSDGKDEYKEIREKYVELVHHYRDGNNCKRIIEKFNL